MIKLKRIYEAPSKSDGYRVLVDRLWPRGVSKSKAALDEWLKEIAPSPELRQWFGHEPARFDEFRARYLAELAKNPSVDAMKQIIKAHQTVTLLYAARDPQCNHTVVLRDFLSQASKAKL